jgi:hypothetical protein
MGLNTPHLLRLTRDTTLGDVETSVRQALAARPWRAATAAETPDRRIIIGRDARGPWVWESAGAGTFAPSRLATALQALRPDVQPAAHPPGEPECVLPLVLDDARQRAGLDTFVAELGAELEPLFPLALADGRLELVFISHEVVDGTVEVGLRLLRYADGASRRIEAISEERLTLANLRLPVASAPEGDSRLPADEVAAEWHAALRTRLEAMAKTVAAWSDAEVAAATPRRLFEA